MKIYYLLFEWVIVIPSKKIAIKFDSIYLHSDKMILKITKGKMNAKEYHQMESDKCKDKGYKLIHIFEEDWIENKKLQLDRILTNIQCLEIDF